jgi:hypothetical protein
MKMSMLRTSIWLALLVALSSSAAESLLERANNWKPGQPIAKEWLTYRKTLPGPAYVPAADDTGALFAGLTNQSLLVEILFQTDIEERVFAAVVERGLHLTGPRTFLSSVLQRYQQKPEWLLFPRHKGLYLEMQERHVMADAMFISETEMPADKAFDAMRHLVSDLQSGQSWEATFEQHSQKLQAPVPLDLPGGGTSIAVSQLSRTGPMVVCETSDARQTFTGDRLLPEHRTELLKRNPGEVLLIRDPLHARVILYRVREVYVPSQSS